MRTRPSRDEGLDAGARSPRRPARALVAPPRRRAGGPGARQRSTRARSGPATSSSACRASDHDGGALRGAGARGRRLGRARRARARRGGALRAGARRRSVLAADDPLAGAAARSPRLAPRARLRSVIGDHRLDRQDLDQGHPRGAARAAPRDVRHAAATSTPRSGCRSRSSARRRGTEVLVLEMAMRGAGQIAELARDRRARRRRDRQRRPGAPRAARHARGDRRGQGGADRRPARRAPPPSSRPASRCSTPHLRDDLDDDHVRRRRRRRLLGAPGRRARRRSTRSGERIELELAVHAGASARATCSPRSPPRGRSACVAGGARRRSRSRRCAGERLRSCPAG